MSISIELPADIESDARSIPDLPQLLTSFIRSQVELERWRKKRFSPQTREIVRQAVEEAASLRARGITREQLFDEMLRMDLEAPEKE